MANEIWILPFFGQGHLFPCMELSKLLATRNVKSTLVIPSNLSPSIPSSLRQHPSVQIVEVPSAPPPPPPQPGADPFSQIHQHHAHMTQGIENLLSTLSVHPDSSRPVCAILDVMMSWSAEIFKKFEIPTVSFFTSGACAAAMEYATWKANPLNLKPGEFRLLPGLPEEVALTYSDLRQRPHGPPPPHDGGPPSHGPGFPRPLGAPGKRKMGPPKPGDPPPWIDETEGSIALLINTCDDLERPFLDYISNQVAKPVWGVGPLLPEQYWRGAGSVLHDRAIRTDRQSGITEEEVIQWLDSKPRGSVLYISFGTEVGPKVEEYRELAKALESSIRAFIWVIQPGAGRSGPPRAFLGGKPGSDTAEEGEGYFPHGLDTRVGNRGLIIKGWAPQLLILSHPSTGGFLSHCGWNSTVEAIGRGVPFLAWPIRGDQYYDAKLLVRHLTVGYMVSDDMSEMIKKEDIGKGIEMLMCDEDMKKRAETISSKFQDGFPASSRDALDAFRDFVIAQS